MCCSQWLVLMTIQTMIVMTMVMTDDDFDDNDDKNMSILSSDNDDN